MIEFFFDCSSPWTWLAFHNLRPMARELGVEVRWRPVLVGGIFNAVNPSVYEFRERGVPAKQTYLQKDLQDWARVAGLEIHFPPPVFPVNSVKAMRGCLHLEPEGRLVPFAEAVFEAYWTRCEDISRDEVLTALCERVGADPQAFHAGIASPAIKDALKRNTDEVIARGGFGSPTIFVGGDDMYFGNDRLVLVRDAVLRRRHEASGLQAARC
ncbi:MAG: 2-hydroxychromene-2-carboxylate isomerase [Lysobacterales bacterium]|nr:MAG: 2-hydroxychromene-2-carboxylate isomerase [Xanthomonadales bacterium]